jgi:hypothetical protein
VWTSGDAVQLKQAGLPRSTVRVVAEVTVTEPDVAASRTALLTAPTVPGARLSRPSVSRGCTCTLTTPSADTARASLAR